MYAGTSSMKGEFEVYREEGHGASLLYGNARATLDGEFVIADVQRHPLLGQGILSVPLVFLRQRGVYRAIQAYFEVFLCFSVATVCVCVCVCVYACVTEACAGYRGPGGVHAGRAGHYAAGARVHLRGRGRRGRTAFWDEVSVFSAVEVGERD